MTNDAIKRETGRRSVTGQCRAICRWSFLDYRTTVLPPPAARPCDTVASAQGTAPPVRKTSLVYIFGVPAWVPHQSNCTYSIRSPPFLTLKTDLIEKNHMLFFVPPVPPLVDIILLALTGLGESVIYTGISKMAIHVLL